MNIHHVLFFCFISALCGDTGLVSAKLSIFTGAEGGSGSIKCYLHQPKNIKFFCKEECKAEDILVKTKDVRGQNSRFSTEYEGESSGIGVLTVSITNLTKSDAGRYRSGLGTDLVPDTYCDFDIRVSDELSDGNTRFFSTDIEGENITLPCLDTVYSKQKFLCKDDCKTEEDIIIETDANRAQSGRYSIEYREGSTFGLYVIITNASQMDTGWYKCGYGRALSPDSSYRVPVLVIGDPYKPNQTLPPFSTSVPSASTPTTQSLKLSSTSFTTSSSSCPKTANQPSAAVCSSVPHPGYIWGLVVLLVILLVVVSVLILYIWKMRRDFRSRSRNTEIPFTYRDLAPASTCEDSAVKTCSD
ncbi:uncharacterized protein LOC115584964 isoform X4 [Sparus aurata]|uniref:uncharacterized protein LOC115584964 isoform X4 n=1 Tax=Sparus aurata TaxID=8175 RepID=UPI0011C1B86B|nr:uncharacterized protein LOC115584964 isoform X4 [Sparus aurata]